MFRQVVEPTQWERYPSRIATTTTKAKPNVEDGKSVLVDGLMKSQAGRF